MVVVVAHPEGSSGGDTASGPMLTNESDVDERLREMNAVFLASLEGLGTTRRGGGAGSRGGSRGGSGSGSGSGASSRSGSAPRPPPPRLRGRLEYGGTGTSSLGLGEPLLQLGMMGESRHGTGSGSPGGSGSARSSLVIGQGSDEVIGRMELDRG